MYDPPHPGEVLREDCIVASDLTVTAAAEKLGISRQALSEVLHGRTGISTEMALRLEGLHWSTAEVWLGMQQAYNLWQARHR
jgi:addiction module HigA family antidote